MIGHRRTMLGFAARWRRLLAGRARREWSRHLWEAARLPVVAAACGTSLAAGLWFGLPSCIRAVKGHPYFALGRIAVDGNRRLQREELLQAAGLYDGISIWDAPPNVVRTRLLSHPWILHVQVQREFPDRLMVRVQERRPAAIVQWDGLHYVDRLGRLLGPLRDDDSRDFPIITGLDDTRGDGFAVIGMQRALRLLRRCDRLNAFDAISEVRVDRERGVTLFPLRTAVAVVLGWGNWQEKLARSARVFAAWEGQAARLAVVDASFRDLVVVKLREENRPPAVRAQKRGTRV